ncbi:DUF4215 domain-containing protein [Nannocystis bainbridge]|uniref:DUF4215 domain-containing protein n=1 Tax=Nannocystis bainbridge TaxID=2995303 RepID=A0ABT5E891_9BACT|nr:DUF4215 domain-containing protein [Nannocystis bainbridge]MDC0721113.1 DUF4215 domain-containing protein [Nannocystis bainbridge]
MTLSRVPLVLLGCFASLAVVAGCGAQPADPTASDSAATEEPPSTTSTTGTSTPAPTTSTGTTSDSPDGTTSSTAADDPTTTTTTSTTDTSGGPVECGDGVVGVGEECDDGNLVDGDGCESDCKIGDVLCGNGVIDAGEACDDGNSDPDDGCGPGCATECGFLCLEGGAPCIPGFHAVQCASPGAPFGQASPIANECQLATLSVAGDHIALSPGTTIDGQPRHLDAMYTDPSNAVFGFAGDTEDIATGSRLVAVNTGTGELTPVGQSLGAWIMGAAMNDEGELWVTVFDTYERNQTTEVSIARIDPDSGEFIAGPTPLTEGGEPVTVWSTHVSDVAFRFDGSMFISANEPGPPPPEPLSRYLEVDRATATVLSAVEGPDDLYAAGIVFVGDAQQIIAMDIRGEDDIFILDLSAPPTLNETLLYADPIPTNSGTSDLAGCSKLVPQ